MGGGGSYPKPTAEENAYKQAQADLLNLQKTRTQEQIRLQDLLAPLLYEKAGLVAEYDPSGKVTKITKSNVKRPEEKLFESQINLLDKQEKLQNLLQPLQLSEAGLTAQYDDKGNLTGLVQDPGIKDRRDLRNRVETQLLERQEKALKGELPINTALLNDLNDQEQRLHSVLRDRLGTDYETSTAGSQALAEFSKRKVEVLDTARRGDIAFFGQLAQGREAANQQYTTNQQGIQGNTQAGAYRYLSAIAPLAAQGTGAASNALLLGTVQAPFTGSGQLGQLASSYTGAIGNLANERARLAQFNQAQQAKQDQLYGALGSLVGTAAGSYFGGGFNSIG